METMENEAIRTSIGFGEIKSAQMRAMLKSVRSPD